MFILWDASQIFKKVFFWFEREREFGMSAIKFEFIRSKKLAILHTTF